MDSLPPYSRALVLESTKTGFEVKDVPTPRPGPGKAIIRVHAAGILSYLREIYNGDRGHSFPVPLVGGSNAIGRVAAAGPDATILEPGQLVYVDCVVRARDDPDSMFLSAIHEGITPGSKKLMRDVWRDGTYTEYASVPLENCILLDEARLCGLGYSVQDLTYLGYMLVPFGGLRDIRLQPGETVVVAPATGGFGGAGVQVAVAMGARVIAMGRNETELARLKQHVLRGTPTADIETVKITGDEMGDAATLRAFGTIDAVLDLSPREAAQSTHVRSAVWALRRGGRVSLMGFCANPIVPIVMPRSISFRGKYMYEREDVLQLVKMMERGLFSRDNFVDSKAFSLEDWKTGFDVAAVHTGIGRAALFTL